MQLTTVFALSVLSIVSVAEGAAIIPRAPWTVWVPKITSPGATTVWKSNTHANVTWDTSGAPDSISNRGKVELSGGPALVHKDLVDGVDLKKGWVDVYVPLVPSGNNYTITLFGDSGNVSPKFEILGAY